SFAVPPTPVVLAPFLGMPFAMPPAFPALVLATRRASRATAPRSLALPVVPPPRALALESLLMAFTEGLAGSVGAPFDALMKPPKIEHAVIGGMWRLVVMLRHMFQTWAIADRQQGEAQLANMAAELEQARLAAK
ncbi:unnamed protein product, partial [Prorocentrum cordatum]